MQGFLFFYFLFHDVSVCTKMYAFMEHDGLHPFNCLDVIPCHHYWLIVWRDVCWSAEDNNQFGRHCCLLKHKGSIGECKFAVTMKNFGFIWKTKITFDFNGNYFCYNEKLWYYEIEINSPQCYSISCFQIWQANLYTNGASWLVKTGHVPGLDLSVSPWCWNVTFNFLFDILSNVTLLLIKQAIIPKITQ